MDVVGSKHSAGVDAFTTLTCWIIAEMARCGPRATSRKHSSSSCEYIHVSVLLSRSLQMTLRFGFTSSLILAGSMTLLAQSHDTNHPQGQPHGPHNAVDPQLHAAMHSLLGTWAGTLNSANGPEMMRLVAANDSDGRLTLTLTSDSAHFGSATAVALIGKGVRWTQALSDGSCRASASLAAAKKQSHETLKGSLICGSTSVPFTLEKAKE